MIVGRKVTVTLLCRPGQSLVKGVRPSTTRPIVLVAVPDARQNHPAGSSPCHDLRQVGHRVFEMLDIVIHALGG